MTNVDHVHELSQWTRSGAKRAMDVGIVLAFFPVILPVLAIIALAVLVTSGMPVFFRQERVGRNGVPFEIYKFRTMRPLPACQISAIAIESASRITCLGAFLRWSKLDELPQMFNVLAGEMSLVGPRPKVPEQQLETLTCRPGLTGAATLAFAREETVLKKIAPVDLAEYFRDTVLSTKRRLDAEYLRRATVWSDLRILADSVLARWDSYALEAQRFPSQDDRQKPSGQVASLCQ